MVNGLEQFKRHFSNHDDKYVLIGGAACMLVLEDAGIDFRATKDLDIVLCVEVLIKEGMWEQIGATPRSSAQFFSALST